MIKNSPRTSVKKLNLKIQTTAGIRIIRIRTNPSTRKKIKATSPRKRRKSI